jgi:hypothetical protein
VRRSFAVVIPALLAALLFTAGAPIDCLARKKKESRPFRVIPGPYDKKHVADEHTPITTRFTIQGLTVEVSPLDRARRIEFIEKLKPGATDPFTSAAGRLPRFMTFRVSFANTSGSNVTFQAGNVILLPDRGEQRHPIDITDLYMQASRAGVDDPQRAVNRIAPLIFDSSTTIRNGHTVERLLVFSQLPEKWRELVLHFSFVQIGAETHTFSFTYHKQIDKGKD